MPDTDHWSAAYRAGYERALRDVRRGVGRAFRWSVVLFALAVAWGGAVSISERDWEPVVVTAWYTFWAWFGVMWLLMILLGLVRSECRGGLAPDGPSFARLHDREDREAMDLRERISSLQRPPSGSI